MTGKNNNLIQSTFFFFKLQAISYMYKTDDCLPQSKW